MDMLIAQGYLKQTLSASAALQSLVGSRVYDRVPTFNDPKTGRKTNPKLPYVTIGSDEGNDQSIQGFSDWSVVASIHVWSRAVGFPEGKRIAKTICDALPRNPVMAGAYEPVIMRLLAQRWLPDPDQNTLHGVLEFEVRYGVY